MFERCYVGCDEGLSLWVLLRCLGYRACFECGVRRVLKSELRLEFFSIVSVLQT